MGRIIKAPNVKVERNYNVVEREKVMQHAEEEAAALLQAVQDEIETMRSQAQEEADGIRAEAQQEAEQVKEQARQEGEQVKEQARQEGEQQGLRDGQEAARQQTSELLQNLQSMLAEGQQILEGMFRDQEQEIRDLVCEIISRIVQEKIESDDELVVRVARECIQRAAERKTLRVLVHPDDQALIESWAPHFNQMYDDIEKIIVETDPRVGRGGVIIETSSGGVDGRIETQEEIYKNTIQES